MENVFTLKPPKKLDYPLGSLLHDVRYYRKPNECFEVVYLDPITNRVEVKYEEAIINIWFLKEEYRTNKYQISEAEKDKCYVVYCKPSQVTKAIALNIGGEYKELYDHMNDYEYKEFHDRMLKCPWVFKADFQPDVYFRLRWVKEYGEDIDLSKITFGLLDIECDVIDKSINPKDITDVTQPVNAVTIILPHVNICALLVLGPRPKENLHQKFHNLLNKQEVEYDWLVNHQEEFKRKIVEEDPDNNKYLKGYDVRIHIFDYDHEIELIKTVFDYINKYRPMFCLSWNAKFDDNYLCNRISYLGYDPYSIIIPKEFKTRVLRYSEDKSKLFSFKNSRDYWFTSTYTVYLCQLRLFAQIRKSEQEPRSYSLSAVGRKIAGIDKLTQTKSGSFRTFAYTDFLSFLLYNVRDVVVQLACMVKSNDCQSLFGRSYMYLTQYSKLFQETHIVRDIREYYYEQDGFVQACRLEVDPSLDTSYQGAFVAPPEKNAPTGYILNGKRVNNIMFGVLDADAASYYPSTNAAMNKGPMTLIYKCLIDNDLFMNNQCHNKSYNQEYFWHDSKGKAHSMDLAGPLINSYKNNNKLSVMYNWFNVGTITDYFKFIDSRLPAYQ